MLKKLATIYQANKKIIWNTFLLVLAYKAVVFVLAYFNYHYTQTYHAFNANLWLDWWRNWDSFYYLDIARDGYGLDNRAAFYPLFPLLIKVFSYIFGFKIGALVVNFLALWGALIGFYKLIKLDFKSSLAWRALSYLLIFPTAIFLNAYYTETIFLCLAIWIFYLVRNKKWYLAATLGFFIGLARIEGQIFLLLMVYEYLRTIDFKLAQIDWKKIILFFSPLLGLGCYALFLYFKLGDPWFFIKIQAIGWGHHFSWPWDPVIDYLAIVVYHTEIAVSGYYLSRAIDLFFFLGTFILGILVALKVRASYGLYVMLATLMTSFSGDLVSANRRSLMSFPIVILLAKWGKNPIVNFLIILLFGVFFNLFLLRFINGLWVG